MINKYLNYIQIIDTGEEAYALISPLNDPNLYIPVRCKIIDLDINKKRSKYIIQILEFYDSIEEVKSNFIAKNWVYARRSSKKDNLVEERKSPNKLRYYDGLETLEDVYAILNGEDETEVLSFDNSTEERVFQDYKERHYLSIDPICVFKTKEHMMEVFNELNQFLIIQKLRDLKVYLSRGNYKGVFKLEKDQVTALYKETFGKKNKKILDTI